MFLKEALFQFIASIDRKLWILPSSAYTCLLFISQGVSSHFRVVFTIYGQDCTGTWFTDIPRLFVVLPEKIPCAIWAIQQDNNNIIDSGICAGPSQRPTPTQSCQSGPDMHLPTSRLNSVLRSTRTMKTTTSAAGNGRTRRIFLRAAHSSTMCREVIVWGRLAVSWTSRCGARSWDYAVAVHRTHQFIFIFQGMCDFEVTQRLAHSAQFTRQ